MTYTFIVVYGSISVMLHEQAHALTQMNIPGPSGVYNQGLTDINNTIASIDYDPVDEISKQHRH